MEDLSTFLELPLQRDLYSSSSKIRAKKPPLKILITEGNTKIAFHLMYKICSGQVFGSDQEIILHLAYSKGKDSKAICSEFYLCGFPLLLDIVASSDQEKIYKDVDVVMIITPFEEICGFPTYAPFLRQVFFSVQVAMKMAKYAKSDSKLVICGPSSKGSIILLTILKQLKLITQNGKATCVTVLDETIAKSLIAAKLKTTTTEIKNVVIWGVTHADIQNGTVFTYPSEDKGQYKKVHIPLIEALQDDQWVQSDLINCIHERVIEAHFASQGMAVAAATARHLKLLFQGSDTGEIISMGVIVPSEQPYAVTSSVAFSFPVTAECGRAFVKENVPAGVCTRLMNLKDEYNLLHGKISAAVKILKSLPLESINFVRDCPMLDKMIPPHLQSRDRKLEQIMSTVPTDLVPNEPIFSRKVKYRDGETKEQREAINRKISTLIRFRL